MASESQAYVTAVKGAVNSSFEEKSTLKEFVCNDLKRKGNGHSWLWILFTFSFIGSALFYSQLYFDVAALQEPAAYFCLPKELKTTNWTVDQIHELSAYSNSSQSCMALKLNYEKLSKMTFEDAVNAVDELEEISGAACSEIGGEIYILDGADSTYADDFGLLCQEGVSNIYAAFYQGCVFGGAVFGILGDKFGRKTSFNMAVLPFIVSSFLPLYFKTSTIYTWSRFFVGFCGFGIVNLFFVMLVENCQRKLREILAIVINLTVVFGMVWQGLLSYEVGEDIRANHVMLAISCAGLIVFIRFLTDSPKHLISQQKYEKAFVQLKGEDPAQDEFLYDPQPSTNSDFSVTKFIKSQEIVKFLFSSNYWHLSWLCMTIYGFWFFAFNFCDMKVDSGDFTSHIKILTVYDAIGYVIIAFLVFWLPRKLLHMSMIITMGSLLILGAALPSEELLSYQFLLTICRCIGNPAIGLFCLHIAEIFPTEIRSTAIGVIGSFGYLVGYYASYIVMFFEDAEEKYSLPKFATILGITSVIFSLLIYMLPETKKAELKDFVTQKHVSSHDEESELDEKNVDRISVTSVLFLVTATLLFTIFMTQFSSSVTE